MGVSVREKTRGSGEYWLYIRHNNLRRAKKIGSKADAERIATIIRGKLAAGDLGVLNNQEVVRTVREYADIWLGGTVRATKAASTAYDYQCIVRKHISQASYYNKPVNEVSKGELKRFLLDKLSSGLAVSTVIHIKNVLGGIFKEAIDDEVLDRNPSHGISIGAKKLEQSRRPHIEPLTIDEVNNLLDTFKEHRPEQYPLLLLLVSSGLRIGEAVSLQWQDIDFDDRSILVQRGFVRGQVEDTTKNGKDRRVDMTEQVAEVLRGLKKQQAEAALRAGEGSITKRWLFRSQNSNKPICYHSWRRTHFYPMLAKAELRKIRIHDLRHTYASIMLSTGCDLFYISRQLGHHSIKVTCDIYGHLLKGNKEKPVDRLADLLATNGNPTATTKEKGASPTS